MAYAWIYETIIAHEMGHAWVQYVDECEDLRTMEAASNPQRMHQLAFVQSFVLDLKVNDLIRRKGFDMSPIDEDKAASMAQLAGALKTGYRPESAREEVFMALLVADGMLKRDCGQWSELARFDDSLAAIRTHAAPLASLAESFADSVRDNGYDNRAAIVRCIDECLTASFEHVGEEFDLDRELVIINEPEPDLNKFPDWLPMLPPKVKCEVGRHMAKNDIPDDWGQSIEPSVTGRARVTFWSPEHDKRSDVLLGARIGPPTRYAHVPELQAELMAVKHRNQTGDWQIHGGPPHPSNPPMGYDPSPPADQRPNFFGQSGPGQALHHGSSLTPQAPSYPQSSRTAPSLPNMPGRSYMAGLGRFLTSVRLSEFGSGEGAYEYAFNSPLTYTDSSGHAPSGRRKIGLPGGGFGSCAVYVCYEDTSFTSHIPGHESICVTGPNGGCSGGYYPTGNPILSPGQVIPNPYPCKPGWQSFSNGHGGKDRVYCDLVSSSCNVASKACGCVKSLNAGYYSGSGLGTSDNCYTWATSLIDCATGNWEYPILDQ